MGANVDEVLTQHLPDARPDKADTCHVEISDLDEGLETELARVHSIVQLLPRDLAKLLNEEDDSVLVQIETALENLVDLSHADVLSDKLAVRGSDLLTHSLVGR